MTPPKSHDFCPSKHSLLAHVRDLRSAEQPRVLGLVQAQEIRQLIGVFHNLLADSRGSPLAGGINKWLILGEEPSG